jgi:hypothetical protein
MVVAPTPAATVIVVGEAFTVATSTGTTVQ